MKSDAYQETMDRLEQGIRELVDSDRWQEFLRAQAVFHQYSTGRSDLSQHCEYQLRKRLRVGVQC